MSGRLEIVLAHFRPLEEVLAEVFLCDSIAAFRAHLVPVDGLPVVYPGAEVVERLAHGAEVAGREIGDGIEARRLPSLPLLFAEKVFRANGDAGLAHIALIII